MDSQQFLSQSQDIWTIVQDTIPLKNRVDLAKTIVCYNEATKTFDFYVSNQTKSSLKVNMYSMSALIRALLAAEIKIKKANEGQIGENGILFSSNVQENTKNCIKLEVSVFNKTVYLFLKSYFRLSPNDGAKEEDVVIKDERFRAFEEALHLRKKQEIDWIPCKCVQLLLEDIDILINFATHHAAPKGPISPLSG